MRDKPKPKTKLLFAAGAALALAFLGTSVTAAPVTTGARDTRTSVPYYYLLLVESDTRVTCIRYAFDCSYTRSPRLTEDPFQVTEGFTVASGTANQPVGW